MYLIIDVIQHIFKFIADGKTYKNILFSSPLFYRLMIRHYPNKRYSLYNQLLSLVKLYPTIDWHWDGIVCNPSIGEKDLERNLHIFSDNFWTMSWNPNLTESFIDKHPFNYNIYALFQNNNITYNYFLKNYKKYLYTYISFHSKIDEIIIYYNMGYILNWNVISTRITMDNILEYAHLPWDWMLVSMNPSITLENIENNLNKKLELV
jgi:hypothetical protein